MPAATYEFRINGPINVVWGALTNLLEYETWNPFIIRAVGTMEPGTEIELVCNLESGRDLRGTALVVSNELHRRLAWEMSSGFRTWTARIEVNKHDEEQTDIAVVTEVKGLRLMGRGPTMADLEDGFRRMAEALEIRVSPVAPVA